MKSRMWPSSTGFAPGFYQLAHAEFRSIEIAVRRQLAVELLEILADLRRFQLFEVDGSDDIAFDAERHARAPQSGTTPVSVAVMPAQHAVHFCERHRQPGILVSGRAAHAALLAYGNLVGVSFGIIFGRKDFDVSTALIDQVAKARIGIQRIENWTHDDAPRMGSGVTGVV